MQFLSVMQNEITTLEMASFPRLQTLIASKNYITSLADLPHLPALTVSTVIVFFLLVLLAQKFWVLICGYSCLRETCNLRAKSKPAIYDLRPSDGLQKAIARSKIV